MKRIFLTIAILAPLFAMAQSDIDMLDYSTVYYQGTAKAAAMGNAIGAVGSDFSGLAINPAGLGLYRASSLVYTPEFYAISTKANYQGNNKYDRAFRLPSNNMGLTWTVDINEGSLNSVSFAVGINRLNNFAYNTKVSGNNPNTSLVNAYFNELTHNNILSENDLEDYSYDIIYPLYYTYVIDSIYPDGLITSLVPRGQLNQQYSLSKRGASHECAFAAGFNFEDKIFLGLSVNTPYFDKSSTSTYKERNLNPGYFNSWSQEEVVKSSGWGINAKIGVIVFPAKWVRVGAAFHTPTIYKVTDSWFTKTNSSFTNYNGHFKTDACLTNYTITTPYRLNASAAFIFGNYGMLTADYEFVDYGFMHASGYDYSNLNDLIKENYKGTSNFRVGTEWRWQTLCFRAGYAFYGSPYGIDKEDLRMNSYSCGIGYTYHFFTVDAAYVFSQRKNTYDLYSLYSNYSALYGDNNEFVDETKVKETTNINQVVISFKIRLD